jgi:hypothetical protein
MGDPVSLARVGGADMLPCGGMAIWVCPEPILMATIEGHRTKLHSNTETWWFDFNAAAKRVFASEKMAPLANWECSTR